MRNIALIVLLTLLAGCATERYYPVQLEGGGHYIAERAYPVAGYDSLWAVGVYPWWVHSFYTPYFYPYTFSYYHPFYDPYYGPYHFAGWYPSWPWYAGYQGSYGIGWPHYGTHFRHPVGQGAVAPRQAQPGQVAPAAPIRPKQVADQQRPDRFGSRPVIREDIYRGSAPQKPGGFRPGPQRITAPVDAARRSQGLAASPSVAPPVRPSPGTAPSFGRSPAAPVSAPFTPAAAGPPFGSEPGRVQRAPSERSRSERHE